MQSTPGSMREQVRRAYRRDSAALATPSSTSRPGPPAAETARRRGPILPAAGRQPVPGGADACSSRWSWRRCARRRIRSAACRAARRDHRRDRRGARRSSITASTAARPARITRGGGGTPAPGSSSAGGRPSRPRRTSFRRLGTQLGPLDRRRSSSAASSRVRRPAVLTARPRLAMDRSWPALAIMSGPRKLERARRMAPEAGRPHGHTPPRHRPATSSTRSSPSGSWSSTARWAP